MKNWIYYPVEWVCSWMTDILITINKGDYNFAKKHMHSKQIEYIPGVGVDTEQIIATSVDKAKKLSELNIDEKNIVVLSVGELSLRKNHETILKAISSLKRTDITYVVCGTGSQKERLEFLAKELGLENNLRLLGFRRDVGEICKCCDIFAFPSTREGLGLAAIEAMAAGVPVLTSNVQGIPDYSINGLTGFLYDPMDVEGFAFGIQKLADDKELRKHMGMHNIEVAKKYDIKNVQTFMQKIYERV